MGKSVGLGQRGQRGGGYEISLEKQVEASSLEV